MRKRRRRGGGGGGGGKEVEVVVEEEEFGSERSRKIERKTSDGRTARNYPKSEPY